jgi:DNA-binding transcriptional LysR family regulator
MDLSLTKLHHLAVVAECGSLSRAAGELNLSQPALSRSIASLEERYGVRIFDRSRKGVTLTSPGAQIVDEALRLLRGARTLDHNLRLYGGGQIGEISVGIGPLVSSIILADLGRQFFARHPQACLRALVRPTDVLVQSLIDGEIEILIGPAPFDFPSEIETRLIGGSISAAFIVRAAHPLAKKSKLDIEEVLSYPLACSVEISWARREGKPSGAFVCDNFHIIREIIPASDLVWVCPQHFVADLVGAGVLTALHVENSPLSNDESPFAVNRVVVGRLGYRSLSPLALEVVEFCEAYFAQRPHIA